MQTVHTFTQLGFRTMPIGKTGYTLTRGDDGKKHIIDAKGKVISFNEAMPSNWTQTYGQHAKEHADTPLGGLICGQLANKEAHETEVMAIDCDNEMAWIMVRALDPNYKFHFQSIGKPGGTILYELPEDLYDLKQYSINNESIHLEYMARRESGANAMVYLPTTANKTKTEIASGAELSAPPASVVALLKSLKPKPLTKAPDLATDVKTVLPFNAPLVKQYVLESRAAGGASGFGRLEESVIAEKVYSIFTPKKFRELEAYREHNFLHPNDDTLTEAGSYSEYITGVSAIAGADPSIDSALYVDFMQAINMQLDDPMKPDRYMTEVLNPMVYGKASINGKPIWKYNENWDKDSHSLSNQYGETLEYFASEIEANRFLEYNHTTKSVVSIQGINPLLDRIYTMDADPQQEKPNRNLVKKLKLVREENSVRMEPGIFMNSSGRTIINSIEAALPLRILRNPELFTQTVDGTNLYVQAFELFLSHLIGEDEESITFMRQILAWHGRHLKAIPVIIYMVGVGGAGKSQFAKVLETLFGSNVTRRPSSKQITSQFNDFLDNCALLILSETADAAKQAQDGIKEVIKTVTGETTIDIETKGRPLKPNVPVFALPVLLANSLWYQEDSADRRIFPMHPQTPLHKAEAVLGFEQIHGVRLIDFILEGIKLGYISKYLSGFCPDLLPEVPLTEVKKEFSAEQACPIARVKSLLQNSEHSQLFELFAEYDLTKPITLLKRAAKRHGYYQKHLVELVKAMREGTMYPSDANIVKAFTPLHWLEMKDRLAHNTNSTGVVSYKEVGRYMWEFDGLPEIYDAWETGLGELHD